MLAKYAFTTGTLAFGGYDPVGTNASSPLDVADSTTALTIKCVPGVTATIALNNGANSANCSGGYLTCMSDGASDYLNYGVYTDNTFATIWDASHTVTYISTAIGTPLLKVNGRIPAGQSAPAGTYTDTITATATF
jgi:spore coat protein U-like protein